MHATLTEIALRAAKPEQGRAVTIWDGALKHFGVRVSSGGAKSFIVLLGSGRRHAIGRSSHDSLAEARMKAKQLLAERTLGRFQTKNITWDAAVEQYLCGLREQGESTHQQRISPCLKAGSRSGSARLSDITKADIARKLDKLHNIPSQQRHALIYARNVLQMGARPGLRRTQPCVTATAPKYVPRSRVLTDDELRRVWIASDQCGTFGDIVKLLILTGQRRGETAALEPEWIGTNTITLPKGATKNGRRSIRLPIGPMTASICGRRHLRRVVFGAMERKQIEWLVHEQGCAR